MTCNNIYNRYYLKNYLKYFATKYDRSSCFKDITEYKITASVHNSNIILPNIPYLLYECLNPDLLADRLRKLGHE